MFEVRDRVKYIWHISYLNIGHNTHFTWWRQQMETFSALLAICAGNSPMTGEFLAQRSVTQGFDVSFDLSLNKRLNEAGDLRRHGAHNDVTPMSIFI